MSLPVFETFGTVMSLPVMETFGIVMSLPVMETFGTVMSLPVMETFGTVMSLPVALYLLFGIVNQNPDSNPSGKNRICENGIK